MKHDTIVAGRILADMSDGVMTIDLEGRIITFNPAAARILGIRAEDAQERSFGELFLLAEENDDFNQTILDAIYESSISHNRIVPYNHDGQRTILSLTTTFLQAEDGTGKRMGVIAVFNDITELQASQEAEVRLADELKDKHRELQNAYLKTEQSNEQLQSALKRVQIIRNSATAFTIILFLGIGLFVWNHKPRTIVPSAAETGQGRPETVNTITVTPQPVSSSISLSGKLQPLQMVSLTSPLTGKVKQVLVRYGDLVTAGQQLAIMDTTEAQIKLREAQAAFIKAQTNHKQMEKWNTGSEVIRAQRSLTKSKMSVENHKKTLDETERLFKKGIVPATEYESAQQQYLNQQLDYQGSEEELKVAHEKGGSDNRKVARFEMENAESRMRQIETEIAAAVVQAPVAGIVMKASASGQAKEGRTLERGASFQQGETLFAVGDLTGFSVNCKIDEIDVTKVKLGQKVRVTGDAFQGEQMTGVIQSISPQAEDADAGGGKGTTSFGVQVIINTVPPELRKRIMAGMTANLEIIIYEKPDALMVPLSAVKDDQGKRYVIRKKGDRSEKVPVTTGYTTQDQVEIGSGLKAGDQVEIIAAGAPSAGKP